MRFVSLDALLKRIKLRFDFPNLLQRGVYLFLLRLNLLRRVSETNISGGGSAEPLSDEYFVATETESIQLTLLARQFVWACRPPTAADESAA